MPSPRRFEAPDEARVTNQHPAVRGVRTILVVTGLAILGAVAGAVLGYLAGMAYVALADVSPIEGAPGITVFYEFVPLGAVLGMMAMPILAALWRRI